MAVPHQSQATLRASQLAARMGALRDAGRFEEAVAHGRKAIAADPRNFAALHNLSRLLRDLGRLKESEVLQRRALALQPQNPALRFGLALTLLKQGRYREAWPYYEARTHLPDIGIGFPQGVRFPRWFGEDIGGSRIAIFPEQGFGDQLQFARFLPWLAARCREIVLLAPPALYALFQEAFPAITVLAASGETHFPKCDVWTTLSDLPARAAAEVDRLPEGAYLAGGAPRPAALRVGLMTKGNPRYLHDAHRTLPPVALDALHDGLAEWDKVDLDPAISGAADFADTARMMRELDLVISVDTAVGHLAGAMGKPCLLLVAGFASDWRWGGAGDTSPWYPHHRLFRGEINGDWRPAIAALRVQLDGAAGRVAGPAN